MFWVAVKTITKPHIFGLKEAFCSVTKAISQFSPDLSVGFISWENWSLPMSNNLTCCKVSCINPLSFTRNKWSPIAASQQKEESPPSFFTFFPHFAAYVSAQWWWCVLRVCMLLPAWAELAGEGRTDYHFPQCVYCWGPGGDSSVAATSARLELSEPLRSCLRHPQQPTLLPLRHAQMSRLLQYVWLHVRMR